MFRSFDEYTLKEFQLWLKEKYGTILCRDLMKDLKVDSSPIPTVRDASFYEKRPCLHFVEDAAQIVDEMIKAQQP